MKYFNLDLIATALLGMVFLAGQAYEFTTFVVDEGMKISTNPAASAFFTLTGFHGTHVLVGVIMLLTLVGISFRRFDVGALLGRRGLEQGFGMRHGDGVAGDHQLHRFHLAGGFHVAQDARDVRGELLVLQQLNGFGADAFE